MSLYFLSFADVNFFAGALARCKIQAENFEDENKNKIFKKVFCINSDDLKVKYPEFYSQHSSFIENNPRGYGYWIWKPYLIWKTMESLNENDILFYMDSGCQLNYSGLDRFKFYCQKADEIGGLNFFMHHLTSEYTKMDTYRRIFPNTDDALDTYQRIGGILFLKCSEKNKNFFKEFYNICVEDSYRYVDDTPSEKPNHESFIDHRHDQSIFSLMVEKHKIFYELLDETWWPPNWGESGKDYPIWATRNPGFYLSDVIWEN